MRRFLPALLTGLAFGGAPSAKPLLDAWHFLQAQEAGGRGRPTWTDAPRPVVPKRWARQVFPGKDEVNPAAYTLCILDRLHQALRCRAVLLAQACNIGLNAVARAEVPALTLPRLAWVRQNYVRVETLTAANARLVDGQAQVPLAQVWGGGEGASADGVRFVVPVRTLHAGWNRKYYGSQRGVTYYNFTGDQFTGFHGIVIPGTLRDSLFILAGLLEQQTSLDPREIIADTHGYSDVVFGLFSLLGYRFSPRLADLADQRFWRLSKEDDYGPLNKLGRHVVNARLIHDHWEDMLRLAGSLKLGRVKAAAVMRTLQFQQALEQWQETEDIPNPDDVARLSPLLHDHVNVLGRYDFTLPENITAGQLRPLRTLTNWRTSFSELAYRYFLFLTLVIPLIRKHTAGGAGLVVLALTFG